jgi:hypothetical protein
MNTQKWIWLFVEGDVLLPSVNSDGFRLCLQQKNNATTNNKNNEALVIIKQEILMKDVME